MTQSRAAFDAWIEAKEREWSESYSGYHDLLYLAWQSGRSSATEATPDGWAIFALTAPGVYTLQQVTHGDREDAERAASRFVRGCDAHVRPVFAGARV